MRSIEKVADEIPRFVRTLYDILHDEDPCILSWSVDGSHFQVFDVPRLELEILPKYFKHCKFASFQRQLNNFGFRKWTKTRASVCTFSHEFLHRCQPSQLAEVVAEMEMHKAAMCAAASHIGDKRLREENEADLRLLHMNLKRTYGEDKHEDEREPEQEMATSSPENFSSESWSLADLCALDWSLVTDTGREDELNALLDPILTENQMTRTEPISSNNETDLGGLPPLDVEYLGDSWIDIFDDVAL
ncbi:Heat stress transcription factor A-1e [Phytophthora citrophthora]|uniref:Heat stress transcription factor A-1e n=1 Tax=Phytophthora citrophthora TaxID=4793 RepID=A0AAD9GU35_9STRA|nr:Heat stress transcription factor A-1e [Phytophthora citrophthora]